MELLKRNDGHMGEPLGKPGGSKNGRAHGRSMGSASAPDPFSVTAYRGYSRCLIRVSPQFQWGINVPLGQCSGHSPFAFQFAAFLRIVVFDGATSPHFILSFIFTV